MAVCTSLHQVPTVIRSYLFLEKSFREASLKRARQRNSVVVKNSVIENFFEAP